MFYYCAFKFYSNLHDINIISLHRYVLKRHLLKFEGKIPFSCHSVITVVLFVYLIVKLTRFSDYQTSRTHFRRTLQVPQKFVGFLFLDCVFWVLVDWAGKLQSHGRLHLIGTVSNYTFVFIFCLHSSAIYPESAAILGFCRKEEVYSRDCVHVVSWFI